MNNKQQYGKFYTTHSGEMIADIIDTLPDGINIIEPFYGNGDLLHPYLSKFKSVEMYDIHPSADNVIERDTLLNPPDYTGKWVITNPPYLHKNRSLDKDIYNKYNEDNLYRCFIRSIMGCKGGVVVIPAVFFFGYHNDNLLTEFLSMYRVKRVKIFHLQAFDDTDYPVCAFAFESKNGEEYITQDVLFEFTNGERLNCILTYHNNFKHFKHELFNFNDDVLYTRAVHTSPNTNILLRFLDGASNSLHIRASYEENIKTCREDERSFASLWCSINLTKEEQIEVIDKYNMYISHKRRTNPLFLSPFRYDKNGIRYRIPISLALKILGDITHKVMR